MSTATIQFTQGANVGGDGQSVLGFVRTLPVTMTDAGGAGATSYLWTVVSWPSPLSSPPTITNATSQVATIAVPVGNFTDGVYIVKLIRVEGVTTTVDVRFFGIGDEDGLILPSPGQSANMHNTGLTPLLAIQAGWAGRANATSNDQLDAYLRFLKTRVGRYAGQPVRVNFTSSSPSTVTYVDGTDKPYRMVLLTGTGLYTEELDAALAQGKKVRYRLTIDTGAGGFALKNGVGGSTIFSLTAPASGTAIYEVEAVYEQTNWHIASVTPISAPSGQVVLTDGSKPVFGFITDANISPTAAIDGAKVVPNFAAQNVVTTGSITGGSLTATDLTASQYVKTDGSKKLVSAATIPVGDLSAAGQTQGDVLYFNGSAWVRLAAGTAGQLLQTNGSSADPSWATVTTTPSGSAGGDLGGTYPNPTVAKINGATVPSAGALTTSHILMVSGASALSYGYIADANVDAAAAIAGSKVSPNFGTQTVTAGRVLYANGRTPQWANVATVSVASSDHTLSAAEYGCPIIEITGTTPADRTAYFPLVNASATTTNGSVWFVRNATLGGFNVNIQGPSGTGVSIPFEGSAVVYTDGVNFYSVGSSGAGGGSSGAASGDLVGSYPSPRVALLTGSGGVVRAVAPFFAIDGTIATTYTFVPDLSTSTAGAGFIYTFQGQHGKATGGDGGGVEIIGGNAGNASTYGGGLTVTLGHNAADATKGGYNITRQHSGVTGVLEAWVDGPGTAIAHVLNTGVNIATGKKLYLGGSSINPVVLTNVPTLTVGAADPTASEATGSIYLKTGATTTYDVFWVRQGTTWASLGQPSGAASGDLSGTYPSPTVAKINGATVPIAGALTTSHVLMVSGASALSYGLIANANVSASAAILGTKISPDFGSQIVQTTNNIQGGKFIVGASGPTITKGTGAPATTEANGSVFLRTDGTDGSDGVYTRQGGAWYQVGAGAGGPPTGPATGDLSGTYPSPTVAKINGATVPIAGALTTSHVLMVSGASALSYGYIADANVSGSAAIAGSKITPNFGAQTLTAGKLTVGAAGPTITKGTGVPVTAAEPAGSLFMRTDGTDGATALYSYQASAWVAVGTGAGATPTGPASGDLSGSYPGPTVAKINGITAPGVAPSAGQYIRAANATTLAYSAILSGDLPNFPGGDLANTYASPQVVGLTGSGSVVSVHGATLRWDSTLTPLLTQATPGSDSATHDFGITSQAPFGGAATNKSPGNIVLTVPSGVAGLSGKVSFTISGSERAYVGLDELTLGASTKLFLGGNTFPAVFSGVGAPGATSAPDGSLYLVRGSTGAATTAYVRASGAWSALSTGGASSAASVSYTDSSTPTFGATDVQGVLDALKSLMAPGGVRLSAGLYYAVYGVSGAQTSGSTGFTGVGIIRFNPNHFFPAIDGGATKKVKFKAYLESTSGLTAEVRLYDLTAASVVSSSTLSTASSTPTLLTSVDIAGNLAAGVEHDYEVQIRLTGSPTSGDQVTCKMAQLEVTYT